MKNYETEIDVACDLAVKAGDAVMEIYDSGDYKTTEKEDNKGPVTDADLLAEEIIVDGLSKEFPEDPICSEETTDDLKRLRSNRLWSIDPIDGTKEFIAKNGEFCVQIGLVQYNRPIIGAVYFPVYKKLIYGGANFGAFLQHDDKITPLQVNSVSNIKDMIVASSRSHRMREYDYCLSSMGVTNEILFGSIGGKVMLILEGKADFFFHPYANTREWDSCAPEAILLAAGGKVTDMLGWEIRYNKEDLRNKYGILASNGANHGGLCQQCMEFFMKDTNHGNM